MMMAKHYLLKRGDILCATEQYIVHQCNAEPRPRPAAGLALEVFKRFPFSDVYRDPRPTDAPGTIRVFHEPRGIVCAFAQLRRGKPKGPDDTAKLRVAWFETCLFKIGEELSRATIALPYGIGCNMAGGNWERDYEPAIERFAACGKVSVAVYYLQSRTRLPSPPII